MTLMSVFSVKNAFVLGADTQETRPSYDAQGNVYELRKAVQKITPETIGNYQIAIAGSGHAQLIDLFIVRAHRTIASDTTQPSALTLRNLLERQLDDFYRNDVSLCQDTEKEFKLLIPYFCPGTREYGVWVSEQSALRDVKATGPELSGWEHELYSGAAEKLFTPSMSIAQGVLASLYVLAIGAETSNYIKDPFHVAIIRDNGIWMEAPDYIRMMSDRLMAWERTINKLFLACADSEISPQRFEEALSNFGQQSALLHKQQLDASVQRMVAVGLNRMATPYPQIPLGTMIRLRPDGSFEADYDVDVRKLIADAVRRHTGSVPEPLRDDATEDGGPSTPSDSQTSEEVDNE
jgi:hypothetical protein